MELAAVVARIEKRLTAVGLSASAASQKAGMSGDAIRNMKRALGRPGAGASFTTLAKLAPVLDTSVTWLLTGQGDEEDHRPSIDAVLREKNLSDDDWRSFYDLACRFQPMPLVSEEKAESALDEISDAAAREMRPKRAPDA